MPVSISLEGLAPDAAEPTIERDEQESERAKAKDQHRHVNEHVVEAEMVRIDEGIGIEAGRDAVDQRINGVG
jgi:hypothetical protein